MYRCVCDGNVDRGLAYSNWPQVSTVGIQHATPRAFGVIQVHTMMCEHRSFYVWTHGQSDDAGHIKQYAWWLERRQHPRCTIERTPVQRFSHFMLLLNDAMHLNCSRWGLTVRKLTSLSAKYFYKLFKKISLFSDNFWRGRDHRNLMIHMDVERKRSLCATCTK